MVDVTRAVAAQGVSIGWEFSYISEATGRNTRYGVKIGPLYSAFFAQGGSDLFYRREFSWCTCKVAQLLGEVHYSGPCTF